MRAPLLTTYRHDHAVPALIDQRRDLRFSATDAELALWRRLRGRALEGAKFRRQQQLGRYIRDFYCVPPALKEPSPQPSPKGRGG